MNDLEIACVNPHCLLLYFELCIFDINNKNRIHIVWTSVQEMYQVHHPTLSLLYVNIYLRIYFKKYVLWFQSR